MSDLAICRRYAAALHGDAEASGVVERVDDDVAMTAATLSQSRDLNLFFASPVVSAAKKRSVIEELFAGRVSDLFLRFLLLIDAKGRGDKVADILQEYRELRNRQLGTVEAQARTAMDLSSNEVEALEKRLSEYTGVDVHLRIENDPSLLGGVVVKVGDTVYDGSLRRQLSVLRGQLEGSSVVRN